MFKLNNEPGWKFGVFGAQAAASPRDLTSDIAIAADALGLLSRATSMVRARFGTMKAEVDINVVNRFKDINAQYIALGVRIIRLFRQSVRKIPGTLSWKSDFSPNKEAVPPNSYVILVWFKALIIL